MGSSHCEPDVLKKHRRVKRKFGEEGIYHHQGVRKDIKTAADMTWLLFILLSSFLDRDLASRI